MNKQTLLISTLSLIVLATACTASLDDSAVQEAVAAVPEVEIDPSPTEPSATAETQETTSNVPAERINRRIIIEEDILFPSLLPYDGIRPIYEPEFVPAPEAPLEEDELVIGISLNGQAKAYPITVLRSREMVNDELGELPILVTW